MAGLDPAIHVLFVKRDKKVVDARVTLREDALRAFVPGMTTF
jgi:hypothetical protein